MEALRIAATGMAAQEANVAVISNNIANMQTTGYKRQRADFEDLFYQNLRRVGTQTSDTGTQVPTGVQLGSGVRLAATPRIHSQGSLTETDKETDVGIRGEGFFQVTLPDGRTAYTRDGSFQLDSTGTLVTQNGYTVLPGITVPSNATAFTISNTGQVQVTVGTSATPTTLGQIQVAQFINKSGLDAIGDNLFVQTAASGAPVVSNPGDTGVGTVVQNYLESSNVTAVTELSTMIEAQRAYEMNSKIVKGADEMLQTTSQMLS